MTSTNQQTHVNNLDKYYEYRVYDKNIGPLYNSLSEYGPCPILVMARHQGFRWNDELFVNAYRRSAGYECHKSKSLEKRDTDISTSSSLSKPVLQQQRRPEQYQQQSIDDDGQSLDVIDVNLTEADCDVWP